MKQNLITSFDEPVSQVVLTRIDLLYCKLRHCHHWNSLRVKNYSFLWFCFTISDWLKKKTLNVFGQNNLIIIMIPFLYYTKSLQLYANKAKCKHLCWQQNTISF